jgi:hypothetical protein
MNIVESGDCAPLMKIGASTQKFGFFIKGMGGRDFFWVVLNVFPQNSQVPNVFPNIFPNSTSLCPICFAQHCPLPTTSIGGPILGLICFYVWNKYIFSGGEGGISKVLQLFCDGPIK